MGEVSLAFFVVDMTLVYCGHQNKLCPQRVATVPKEVNNETNLRMPIAFGNGNTARNNRLYGS